MIERQIGGAYPVDGESFAHGKATDWEITYEYDDIYTAIVEELLDDPMTEYIMLGDTPENIAQFLGENYAEELVKILSEKLIDDDFGEGKHTMIVEDFVTDKAEGELEMIYERTDMV